MIFANGIEIEQKFFPDGTFNLMNIPKELVYEDECVEIIWHFKNISEQVLLYNLVKHLRNYGNTEKIILNLPYVPNARMDRIHNHSSEVPTLKFFCDFINDLNFYCVKILDPHSDVATMLLDRCVCLHRASIFSKVVYLSKPDVILYPDTGAMKRYAKDSAKIPFIYAEKIRDWKTGKIQSLEIKNPQNIKLVPETKVLISDDICSKGGTFYYAAKELNKLSIENIDLYVTHCESSIREGVPCLLLNDSPIKRIYTTNSIDRGYLDTVDKLFTDKVTVIDVRS